ncbi:MAG: hypothetical protein CMJ46_15365, partial [Planctomyces sp.]|nr:hypothetical protein [Planctomyces sp.]
MSSRTKTSGWLVALALIPVFFCMIAHVNGVTSEPLPEARPRPALVFQQYAVEWRHPSLKVEPRGYFAFVNQSATPVRLDSIERDCGCVRIELFPAGPNFTPVNQLKPEDAIKDIDGLKIQPREAFYLRASVDGTTKEPGLHEFDIKVSYEDIKPRETTLHFNVLLPEKKIVLEPELITIAQIEPKATSKSLWIADYRGHDFNVTSIRSNSDWFTAELGEIKYDEIKRQEIVVTTTDKIPGDRVRGIVEVNTDDPEVPQLRFHVYIDGIQGKLKPFIAERDSLVFKFRPGSPPEEGYVGRLISLPDYKYQITGIDCSVDWIKPILGKPELDEFRNFVYPVLFEMTPPEGVDTYREKVKLTLNDPEWPTLEIPIKVD